MNASTSLRSLFFFGTLAAAWAEEAPAFFAYQRPVIIWVAPYATAKARAHLREQPAERDPASALTHVAFQFWTPTAEGGVRRVARFDPLPDEFIADWRDWCHAHGLRALLCLYNGEDHWDWALVQSALKHPDTLVPALIAELEARGLDGIDLDLEGDGNFEADQPAYLAFVKALAPELRARGRQLFVDSFCYRWNAPNQHWWPELFPLVDGLNSMGYEETGSRSEGWRGYSAQIAAAGPEVAKLLIGVPTHTDRWEETPALGHLEWLAAHPGPGVALWDAQLKATLWRTEDAWSVLRRIRGQKP